MRPSAQAIGAACVFQGVTVATVGPGVVEVGGDVAGSGSLAVVVGSCVGTVGLVGGGGEGTLGRGGLRCVVALVAADLLQRGGCRSEGVWRGRQPFLRSPVCRLGLLE